MRETRQAHNQFVRWLIPSLLGTNNPYCSQPQAEGAFRRLKDWLARWQPPALKCQPDDAQWRAHAAQEWPESLVAAAWMALLIDANPCPQAQEKDVPPLLSTPEERKILAQVSDLLLSLLADSASLAEMRRKSYGKNARDLMNHCKHLIRFKTI